LLALGRLTIAAGVRGARQHAILGGHPAFALAAHEGRHAILYAGRHQHAGIAKADKARTFGVLGEGRFDRDGPHLVGRAS